jgi:hypothetical protein
MLDKQDRFPYFKAPKSKFFSINSGIGTDNINYECICDKNGDFWMKGITKEQMHRRLFAREVAKKILEVKKAPMKVCISPAI